MEIKPLKLSKQGVWEKVEQFRGKYLHNEDMPVNIEVVMQTVGIQLIPVPGYQAGNLEGHISLDFKNIYVDEDQYISKNGYNVVRFTIAHEIGHKVLHYDIIKKLLSNGIKY